MKPALAELISVSKNYAHIPVLKGVDFSVYAGEVHALLGGNGAGKSTLMKILAGLVTPTGGQVRIGGKALSPATPSQAQAMGLYLVPQEAHIFPNQSVLENVCVGLPQAASAYRSRVKDLIARLGVTLGLDTKAATLEIADRQIVEILRGLIRDAKVLILDEPTSALTPLEVETLFTRMRALRESGHGLVFISHKLHELRAVSDRITVLRDGHVVHSEAMEDSTDAEILAAMSPGVTALSDRVAGKIASEEKVLSLSHLSGEGFVDISLDVHRGEVLGLTGVVGAGRTELAETLIGLRPRAGGDVMLEGRPFRAAKPSDAVKQGVVHLSEDRQQYGLFLEAPLYWNTSSFVYEQLPFFLRPAREQKRFETYRKSLGIKCASPDQPVGSLSGGNQQKVLLSKCLAAEPKLLILDEPTRGVDVGARNDIYRIIEDLAATGTSVIVISSDFDEVVRLSDRIAVMAGGHLAGELPAGASTDAIGQLAFESKETLHA
ncbi:autoinducer 2 ABC transporter ATP-binding protein LsrA [Celeribacter halophilus]|uniref:Autoinducer 2 import ATP-binding protein LsrA n=1 Tax=Celeribacter halophilus TaxID=576117 RepID=A0A1I3WKI5_9RHOB|nr:autoinducer 2 ABC transporter ATP-binding protein LsrA [Celeribacter halophilus]PZX09840.1 AI-2 transport system ATP-binding protein [Celeribacter halophilus]SFK06966.1 monosaccharide ABC transporter ATP-binding protein, CUT2 family (TC 3.A.1.2.-) [Celeribacter halophilus]